MRGILGSRGPEPGTAGGSRTSAVAGSPGRVPAGPAGRLSRLVDVAQDCPALGAGLRELVIFCLDSAVKWPSPFIDNHIRKALEAGMSAQQLVEAAVLTARSSGRTA